jgi:hypothetical protein
VQITADEVDAEKKISAYLLKDNEYQLELRSDNQPVRVLGSYIATTEGDKVLHVYEIQSRPGPGVQTYRNGVTVFMGTGNVSDSEFFFGVYNDSFNKTTSVELFVYKMNISGDILLHAQVNDSQMFATLNLSAYENFTIVSRMVIIDSYGHTSFMNTVRKFIPGNAIITEFITTLANVTADDEEGAKMSIKWFFLILFSLLALTATMATAEYMGLALIAIIGIIMVLGWFSLSIGSVGLLGVGLLVVIISFMKKKGSE